MSIREVNPSSLEVDAIAEAELQEELRGLFVVDTQNYLEKYSQLTETLQPETWKTDIQELYRCIHTIKGGAVTVAAEAVLRVATALEDLLSDLRYLEVAPPLADLHLQQTLLEGGELLTGVLVQDTVDIEPILHRVETLHQEVRTRYLSHWNPQRQLHQDFAEQGLDMVVLELQIALERLSEKRLPPEEFVSAATIDQARQTLNQLYQIGDELQFATGWTDLLHQAEELFACPTIEAWQSQWFLVFQALKTCAKQSGNPIEFTWIMPIAATTSNSSTAIAIDHSSADENLWGDTSSDLLDVGEFLERELLENEFLDIETEQDEGDVEQFSLQSSESELLAFSSVQDWLDLAAPSQDSLSEVVPSELETFDAASEHAAEVSTEIPERQPQPAVSNLLAPQPETIPDPIKVQIPVSLEKLDRSAQYLVETLLALRSTQGLYQVLQNQLTQLVALAQEGVQSITHLRQIQDDYALLDLQGKQPPQGLTPERYRQGYTVINRLLETNLRLSEIGAEAGKMTEQITENLRSVDGSVLKLQNTIEDSRLVSFQTLGIRARAILRDLVTRYGKPARLIVLGEQTELDVSTARALEPVLLHLVRNAYDHGLETPTERVAQGKPEQGTIVLSLRRRGNQFSLEFKDDGRGLNAEAVRSRAAAFQFPLTQTATSEELLQVICQPGFSSEAEVNEISGRGVGMDVVAAQIAGLCGQLGLHTVPGTGTTFQIQFPAPRLLVPCVLVQAGDYTFAIPEDEIRTITLLGGENAVQTELQNSSSSSDQHPTETHKIDSVYRWVIQNEASSVPALDLLEYWQPHLAGRSLAETAVCLFIQPQTNQVQNTQDSSAEGIWLLADELLEQTELVINLLPSPLVVPPGILGVSLQVNGSLVPVLEARTLAEWWLDLPTRQVAPETIDSTDSEELTASRLQTILVVDDATLMRRRLEASLSANGYRIYTCVDGQEAWNWLKENPHPSLILTDIEMPNMDGFTLIDRCRQSGITVPILVVSSRLSEEWFNEARRLGATDYLTKGFATVDLISKVSRLLTMSGSATK
ncbi:response regulator [Phormidium tenue FACHB-886]|nr:response regulator [Phormidium tenue FACHB-886]